MRVTISLLGLTALLFSCSISAPQIDLARIDGGESRRQAHVDGLPGGESLVIEEIEGPGVIHHLWFTAMSDDPQVYAGLVLRIWWDGEAKPSIEVPMGDFFGCGFGDERLVRSAAVEMIPAGGNGHAALTCWLPMPFESARIEVENQSAIDCPLFFHVVNWERVDRLGDNLGRLHAQWRRTNPVTPGRHHIALQAEGKGRFVGIVQSIRRLSGGAWVEGGEDFFIDIPPDEWAALENWDTTLIEDPQRRVPEGAVNIANQPALPVWPTLPGIGGEDYYCQSWGYHAEDQSLFHGVSLGPENMDDRMTAYRFHVLDPIYFDKNLWMIQRNHGWDVGPRGDDLTTVTYWYQSEPHLAFPTLPPLSERIPPLE